MTEEHQRTNSQNAALHLWFDMLAQAFEEADIDLKALLEAKSVSVPVSGLMVKNIIWKPVQNLMFDKPSTTQLDRAKEIDAIYDVVNRHLIENFIDKGNKKLVIPAFPSYDEQRIESLTKENG